MKIPLKRLAFAALTSSSVFAATWFWYQYADDKANRQTTEKPLAYVGKVIEDIQRRPADRLLWQGVNTGEPLYNGEAVRTSAKGEVRIQFADSERYLDLEPESLIVIKKNQSAIALDLMEGSLFVNSQGAGQESGSLVLNSGKGTVDLSKASANLAKSSGDKIDVQVVAGQASMTDASGKRNEISQGASGLLGEQGFEFDQKQLKILLPHNLKTISLPADKSKPVIFQWQGFPLGSKVSLWLGDTRKGMKEVSGSLANATQLSAQVPFGNHFWKLVAKTPEGRIVGESSTYRTQVNPRYGAGVISPVANATVISDQVPMTAALSWEKTEEIRNVALEVWSDTGLKTRIFAQSFPQDTSYNLADLKPGTYFWRLTSYYEEGEVPLVGELQSFTVKTSAQAKKDQLPPLVPVDVFFTMPATQTTQYFSETPAVNFTWGSDKPEQVKEWRLKVYSEDQSPADIQGVPTQGKSLVTKVDKPGRYIASIEALDKDGRIVGSKSSASILVAPMPLLKSPQFFPTEGPLQARMDGRSLLSWQEVDGAKEYWLVIKKDGKVLRRSKHDKTSTALKNLLPGEYQVEVSVTDKMGRDSEGTQTRRLVVPDKSDIKAPTLKRIKVN